MSGTALGIEAAVADVDELALRAADLAERVRQQAATVRLGVAQSSWRAPSAELMRAAASDRAREIDQAGGDLEEASRLLRVHARQAQERAVALERAAELAQRALTGPVLADVLP